VAAAVRQCDGAGPQVKRPTIFARATGALPSAIAIIRVSGPAAEQAIVALTGRTTPPPRRAVVRALHDHAGASLDRALVIWMPGPRTATGEDVVELHVHGGPAVVHGVEAALSGIETYRAAEPGEFTRRAFENGLIDLTQVEGLGDLVAARTAAQRAAALAVAEGGLRREVEQWRDRLLALAAQVEALIDHEDEVGIAEEGLVDALQSLRSDIAAALARPPAERLRDGVRVGVAGPPNAGKSTLINAIAGREVAIVTDVAGTTRDLIEVPLDIDGIPIVLIDMAGLRDDSGDPIERIGIARAEAEIERCDLLLWLGDPENAPLHANLIRVGAKADLGLTRGDRDCPVSARTGSGMAGLRALLVSRCSDLLPSIGSTALSASQREHLVTTHRALSAAEKERDLILRAEHLRIGREAIDRMTGRADTEALLTTMFTRLCIGK
jgi:tRNA modification GTPase